MFDMVFIINVKPTITIFVRLLSLNKMIFLIEYFINPSKLLVKY
jgi:hypothetical protein